MCRKIAATIAIRSADIVIGLKVPRSDVRIDLLIIGVGLSGSMNGRHAGPTECDAALSVSETLPSLNK